MKVAHFFIDHPRFATVINIFIAVAGLATMVLLPIAQYPNIVPPTIDITTSFPGASGETVARTVANINPYLVEVETGPVHGRATPIARDLPEVS